jgi:hypothetical protein
MRSTSMITDGSEYFGGTIVSAPPEPVLAQFAGMLQIRTHLLRGVRELGGRPKAFRSARAQAERTRVIPRRKNRFTNKRCQLAQKFECKVSSPCNPVGFHVQWKALAHYVNQPVCFTTKQRVCGHFDR